MDFGEQEGVLDEGIINLIGKERGSRDGGEGKSLGMRILQGREERCSQDKEDWCLG